MASRYRFVHVSPMGISFLSNFQRDFRERVEEWGLSIGIDGLLKI